MRVLAHEAFLENPGLFLFLRAPPPPRDLPPRVPTFCRGCFLAEEPHWLLVSVLSPGGKKRKENTRSCKKGKICVPERKKSTKNALVRLGVSLAPFWSFPALYVLPPPTFPAPLNALRCAPACACACPHLPACQIPDDEFAPLRKRKVCEQAG